MEVKEIWSLHNPIIKHLVKLRTSRVYRTSQGSVVLPGKKLVREVCYGEGAKALFLLKEELPFYGDLSENIYLVTPQIMKKISGLESPEGVLAEVLMPHEEELVGKKYLLALDGICDPGNMGTLLRTALALGWEGVFILGNSVDLFNEKALRAAKGATFRFPYRIGSWEDLKSLVKANSLKAFVGDMNGKVPGEVLKGSGALLVLGNEASGPSREVKEFCCSVGLPMPGDMESLNVAVAGGILMYLLKHL